MNFKYQLHYHLMQLTVPEYQAALKFLPNLCQVTKQTFREWVYRKEDNGRDIPALALLRLAAFFEVQPTELYTNAPSSELILEDWETFKKSESCLQLETPR